MIYKWDFRQETFDNIKEIGVFPNYDIIWRRLPDGTIEMSPDNHPVWSDWDNAPDWQYKE